MDIADVGPRPRTMRCLRCRKRFPVKPHGPTPIYCSPSCKQAVFRKRKQRPKQPPITDEEQHRRMIWEALKIFKLVEGDMPQPKPEDEAT